LGYPVNTVDDEVYFHPSSDGRRGYLASVREEGQGFTDIYMVKYTGNLGQTARSRIVKLKKQDNKYTTDQELSAKQLIDSVLSIAAYQVYFDLNSTAVNQEYEKKLNDMATFLNGNTNLGVQISAFASSDGNPRYNLELSSKRAQAVLEYFVSKGVEDDRLAARGFGILSGLEDKSRRAEVKILNLADF
jgi:outer membrane protein OmpA-like peptidoglycan-associated protein